MKRTVLLLLAFVLVPHGGASAKDPEDEKKKQWADAQFEKFFADLSLPDSVERARAVEGIGRVGLQKGGVVLVRHGLVEKQAHIVALAGEVAAMLDPTGAFDELKVLVEKNRTGSNQERRNLVILLREFPGEEAAKLLFETFSDTRVPEVQVEVLSAIGLARFAGGISYVRAGLAAGDPDMRNVAAIAAGRLGAPELIPALFAALDNSDAEHCKFAAWALNRIDDPTIFADLQPRLGSASGVSGEAKAKVIEGSARIDDVDRLLTLLTSSSSREYREAAAIALGRLGNRKPEVQHSLFNMMLRDGQREVRGASWHALMRVATEEIVPMVRKRLNQRDPELLKYIFHLIGHLKIADEANSLLKVIINERKDTLLRFSAAINFWKAADPELIASFEERLPKAKGQMLEHGLEALGFRRNEAGLDFALNMLRHLREGSREQYLVEKSLERMTGHFFGPYPGLWKRWFEKYPNFFTPKQSELERNKWREDFDKENKGFRQTAETEYSVQLGLDWLARHQHADGRFDPQRFYERCDETPRCQREGARVQMDSSGTTALAVLAFTGAGYGPERGKYKHVVRRALEYLMARQQANGNFLTNDLIGGYHRPLGAQAFAEAYILTGDENYAWHSQVSLDFLTTIQNKLGAWRYRVIIQTTDTSCMSWNLFALKTGEKAGLTVQEIAVAGCYNVMDIYSEDKGPGGPREDFIDMDPAYGYEVGRDTDYEYQTGYQNPVWDSKYATVPLGIMCRIFLGWRRSHPFCIGSANKILADMLEPLPKGLDWSKYRSKREYPTYAWYYGTLAMHQMGGRYFRTWNERIQQIIPNTQEREGCTRGTWPMWNHDSIFGRVYTTAMGTLTLETYYRYLPVLQD